MTAAAKAPRAPRRRPGVLVTLAPEETDALDALAAEDTVRAGVPVSRSRVVGLLALAEVARRHPPKRRAERRRS